MWREQGEGNGCDQDIFRGYFTAIISSFITRFFYNNRNIYNLQLTIDIYDKY